MEECKRMKITLGDIQISSISESAGVIIGHNNTYKNFRNELIVNEVVGALSGDQNQLTKNRWIKNREKWEGERL